ncbi:MAG: tRNA 2-thiouridine(34) synthase MnmA [Chthoniobacterales bacterium]
MKGKNQRVLLGMSGGVDSSVAGHLLREEGYDVVGVTMKVWPQDCISRAEDKCCGPQAIADARGVAHSLGFPHYVVDEADQFERVVIDYFSSEYQAGRTPNPCVMCNEKLKFGSLWEKAQALDCDYIATGHYAIIEQQKDRAVLRKGRDLRKDQSYFLFSLRQPQLRHALTPLGNMEKTEIREIARSLGLKVANKVDSQEICFVPGNDYKAFLRGHLGENEFHRGGIFDLSGNFLAEHEGIEMFTIGQRKGLPGGSPKPRYVVDIDPGTNRVLVGDVEDLLVEEFEIDRVNWVRETGLDVVAGTPASAGNSCIVDGASPSIGGSGGELQSAIFAESPRRGACAPPIRCNVKIRYSHPGASATLIPLANDRALVRLDEPQKAVTPGQAAVCYDGDVVVAGGWICRHAAVGAAT